MNSLKAMYGCGFNYFIKLRIIRFLYKCAKSRTFASKLLANSYYTLLNKENVNKFDTNKQKNN